VDVVGNRRCWAAGVRRERREGQAVAGFGSVGGEGRIVGTAGARVVRLLMLMGITDEDQ
jgi:hypothetical protein